MNQGVAEAARGPRSLGALVFLSVMAGIVFAGFMALGTWQIYRLSWKLDLIRRVDARVHAAPVAPPPANAVVTAASDEYRHVRVTGHYVAGAQALVRASTDLGSGSWVMSPLRQADGSIVMINRGFVPQGWCVKAGQCPADPAGPVTVTGLLRVTEPRGGFLSKNDPAGDHWYSRDVRAIGEARHLSDVAGYFIDEEASAGRASDVPVGGLTVISFPNNHLVYAITWFGLALMTALGTAYVAREERRLRRDDERRR